MFPIPLKFKVLGLQVREVLSSSLKGKDTKEKQFECKNKSDEGSTTSREGKYNKRTDR